MKIIEKEFNVITGEETITERDETPDEQTQRQTAEVEAEALAVKQTKINAAKTVATAKLAALGLTTDDLKALGL